MFTPIGTARVRHDWWQAILRCRLKNVVSKNISFWPSCALCILEKKLKNLQPPAVFNTQNFGLVTVAR